MSEANKALVRDHYEQLTNRMNYDAADEQLAPDFVDHEMPPGTPPGPGPVKAWLRAVHAGFPDLRVTLDDMVAEGDRVAVRATWRGTHSGTFLGLAGTGQPVAFSGMVFWRVRDGRIAERWAVLDRAALLDQLAGGAEAAG